MLMTMVIDDINIDEILNKKREEEAGVNEEKEPSDETFTPLTLVTQQQQLTKKNDYAKPCFLGAQFLNNLCHYYSENKCKFGKECRKEHKKMCNQF